MDKVDKDKWVKWLKSELSDYDKRHKLGEYQVMADLPPGEAYKEQIKATERITTLKMVMEQMLSFLLGKTNIKEAKKQALFARNLPEYASSKKEVQYIYDTFVKIAT